MSDVKIADLTPSTTLTRDDLMMLSQVNGNSRISVQADLGKVVAGGFLEATNITVATSAWTQQATPDFDGYPYVATLALQGVTTNDVAEVIPSLSAINDGKLCPLNRTVANGVNIYSMSTQTADYVIERVSVRRSSV